MFGRGQYAPETTEGKGLLAHELAHVAQQRAHVDTTSTPLVDEQETVNERIAEAGAEAAVLGRDVSNIPPLVGAQPVLQRQREGARRAGTRTSLVAASGAGASRAEVEEVEMTLRDLRAADNYVIAFYTEKQKIKDDLADAMRVAIDNFTDITGIPEDRLGANIT